MKEEGAIKAQSPKQSLGSPLEMPYNRIIKIDYPSVPHYSLIKNDTKIVGYTNF